MREKFPSLLIRSFQPGDQAAILRIKQQAIANELLPVVAEGSIERWVESLAVDPAGVLVADVEGSVVGYLAPHEHEIVVERAARRHGIGRALVSASEREIDRLLIWLPDDNPGATAFFGAIGYVYFASLWELTLAPDVAVPYPAFPPDVQMAQWSPDVDIDEFVDVFNTAFLDHPTPITVTRELVEWAEARDSEGLSKNLLLHTVVNDDQPGKLIGFARTRMVPSEFETSGEIDFLALLREWRGRGLGKALLAWAIELYLQNGFAPTREWRRYGRLA
jgi:mycothiol synthase